ncbi:MAG: very short patch repair endonuclease [Gammaproteobacteria bacterium]|nr:very short patch repair endonuclease [Gammaproteobacteria bacterium]MBU1407045.1 very short patch repair endonuclease [Gammaproteobacteria bacterium]
MTDIVSPAVRSRMMSGIRSKNTGPEISVRKALHRKGLRYRLHARDLPGKPDITLPRHRAVVFVHGCFWHGHDCALFRLPATRTDFWKEKIERNQANDRKAVDSLLAAGWRVAIVWECALHGKDFPDNLASELSDWITHHQGADRLEIRGYHRTMSTTDSSTVLLPKNENAARKKQDDTRASR